jgi:hypothetical protein
MEDLEEGWHLVWVGGTRPETLAVSWWSLIEVHDDMGEVRLDVGDGGTGALLLNVVTDAGVAVPGALLAVRDASGQERWTGGPINGEQQAEIRKRIRSGPPKRVEGLLADLSAGAASLTNRFGLARLGGLPPGEITIEVEAEGFVDGRFVVPVEAGRLTRRELVLRRK